MSMKEHEKRIQQLLQLLHILLRSTCFHIWIGRLLISHPVSHFSSLLLDHETNSLAWFFGFLRKVDTLLKNRFKRLGKVI